MRVKFAYPIGAYVYAILVDGLCRYIGKGTNGRAWEHEKIARRLNESRSRGEKVKATRFYNRLAKALRDGASVEVRILRDGLTDDAAFLLEIEEIADADQSWNEAEGGLGFTSASARRFFADPEVRKRMSEAAKARGTDPDYCKLMAGIIKAAWADPNIRERQVAGIRASWNPKRRKRMAQIVKARWADSKYRERQLQTRAASEFRERQSQAVKAGLAAPEVRKRKSESMQAVWDSSEHRERHAQAMADPIKFVREYRRQTEKDRSHQSFSKVQCERERCDGPCQEPASVCHLRRKHYGPIQGGASA